MMKSGFVLALLALGLAGFVVFDSCERAERLAALEKETSLLRASVSELTEQLDRARGAAPRAEPELLTANGPAGGTDGSSSLGNVAGLATRGPVPGTDPLARLAAVEEALAKQKETVADLRDKAEKQAASVPHLMRPDAFYHNLDAAARSMELNERQKADMQDTLDRATRELADLYAIENDAGQTWAALREGAMTTIGGEGGLRISMPDFGKIAKFKQSKIPGTSESYGQAESRIKKSAFDEMRRGLTPAQAKKWDGANKDPLLGSSGASGAIMSFTMDASDQGDK